MYFGNRGPGLALLVIVLLMASLALAQSFPRELQYDRALILQGQYWRLISCHFVHSGWKHLILNLAGAMLVFSLFYQHQPFRYGLMAMVFCSIGTSISLLIFSPQVDWYVGFSGVLHGLLVAAIVAQLVQGNSLYVWGLLLVVTKLCLDGFSASSELTGPFIGAMIIREAHVSGAVSGGLAGLIVFRLCLPDRPGDFKWPQCFGNRANAKVTHGQ